MFSPRILLCLLAHWYFPSVILHWLVAYNINILFPHLVGEAEDIRRLVVNALIDHLVCFVACMVHHTSGDALGSVIWCLCAFASFPCFESLALGCDGIIYFLIPPPSFKSPSVGLCCAAHLFCCLLDIFLKTFFMYARPIPVQIKVQFKNLQFLSVTYDMGVLSCAVDIFKSGSVVFLCLISF